MTAKTDGKIGFTCAYTPLPLIDAAGFTPYRILPTGGWPDQAGHLLHDNLCPHIKRILDRAMDNDLPDLAGVVFMNSCEAMRRLAQAWKEVRPDDSIALIDLPSTADESSISFFTRELSRLWKILVKIRGNQVATKKIEQSVDRYNEITRRLKIVRDYIRQGKISGGQTRMQKIYNQVATEPARSTSKMLKKIEAQVKIETQVKPTTSIKNRVPVFLFGNVLPDPEVFKLFEDCGVLIVGENLCTGSRMIGTVDSDTSKDVFIRIARGLLSRPPCARTIDPLEPGKIAEAVIKEARGCGAAGVIGHTVKFCDPYLDRFPTIRDTLKQAGIPLLLLEGDLTLGAIGQHRTRIEAFIEMLE